MIETPEERRARRLASYGDTHAAHGHALPDVQVGLQDANDVEACCGRTVPHAKRDDVGTALEARHRMCQLSAQHRKHRGGHGVTVAGSRRPAQNRLAGRRYARRCSRGAHLAARRPSRLRLRAARSRQFQATTNK